MAVAQKAQDTHSRLQAAQTRVAELTAEVQGLPGAMQQALKAGDKNRYLDLMVRENQLPRELVDAETEVQGLYRQSLQERYAANAAEEPGLRAKHEEAVRRNQERIAAIEAETSAAAAAYFANVNEGRALEQELRAMGVVVS